MLKVLIRDKEDNDYWLVYDAEDISLSVEEERKAKLAGVKIAKQAKARQLALKGELKPIGREPRDF